MKIKMKGKFLSGLGLVFLLASLTPFSAHTQEDDDDDKGGKSEKSYDVKFSLKTLSSLPSLSSSDSKDVCEGTFEGAENILFLASGTEKKPLLLARQRPESQIFVTDYCPDQLPQSPQQKNYHPSAVDNTQPLPFRDNEMDVIVMNQGLCACPFPGSSLRKYELLFYSIILNNQEEFLAFSNPLNAQDWFRVKIKEFGQSVHPHHVFKEFFTLNSPMWKKMREFWNNPGILQLPEWSQYKAIDSFKMVDEFMPLAPNSCGGIPTNPEQGALFFGEVARVLNKKNPGAKAFLRGPGTKRLYKTWTTAVELAMMKYGGFNYVINEDILEKGIILFPDSDIIPEQK